MRQSVIEGFSIKEIDNETVKVSPVKQKLKVEEGEEVILAQISSQTTAKQTNGQNISFKLTKLPKIKLLESAQEMESLFSKSDIQKTMAVNVLVEEKEDWIKTKEKEIQAIIKELDKLIDEIERLENETITQETKHSEEKILKISPVKQEPKEGELVQKSDKIESHNQEAHKIKEENEYDDEQALTNIFDTIDEIERLADKLPRTSPKEKTTHLVSNKKSWLFIGLAVLATTIIYLKFGTMAVLLSLCASACLGAVYYYGLEKNSTPEPSGSLVESNVQTAENYEKRSLTPLSF